MKLLYIYSNGRTKEHTKYISKENINREKNGAKFLTIYKIHKKFGELRPAYDTTLILH